MAAISESVRRDAETLIKHFEGEHLTSYVVPGESWATVGIGCAIPMSQHPLTITKEECRQRFDAALDIRIKKIPTEIGTANFEKLNDGQKVAYLSFRFNAKDSEWLKSNTRKKLMAGDVEGFFKMARTWCHGEGGKKLAGLVRRRDCEDIMAHGGTIKLLIEKNWLMRPGKKK